MSTANLSKLFALSLRWADDLKVLDEEIAACSGKERDALIDIRNGVARCRVKLITGVNGYWDISKEDPVWDDDLPVADRVQRLLDKFDKS